MTPELTTISQPIEEMGKLAVQMIIHHGEEISYQKENIFDVELIRRQTTKKERRSRMKLAVVGSINMDMTVAAERIPLKGETLRGDSLHYIPGGKGANQAVAMTKLGAKVEMFGCVGDDANGTRLLENFKKVGVETGHIKVLEGVPTGIAMITVGENDNTIIVVPGANGKVDRDYELTGSKRS